MIHHVFANRQNIGDWLSARGIQSLLGDRPVREHLCDAPYVTATLAALAEATAKDVIVIGGGGLFMDYFEPFWEGFRARPSRAPYSIWGVGCCDSTRGNTLPAVRLVEEVVRGARRCVVRDDLTRRFLANCQLPAPVACPSLCLMEPAPPTHRGLLHVANFNSVGESAYEQMVAVARAFAKTTGRIYRETNHQIPRNDTVALGHQLDLYRTADTVLSSGLHGCVLAVGHGRPVVAVSADRKVDAFMTQAGLGEWVCPADHVERLPELLRHADQQPSPAAFVSATRQRHRQIAAEILAEATCG